jgi:SSS family solute:Na+ symporter
MILATTILYSIFLLGLGTYAYFRSGKTEAEFFVAGRSLGTFVVLMSLVFSMWSAFALMGMPAAAYLNGVGMLGVAVGVFWAGPAIVFVGYRISVLGQRYNWVTPGDFMGERYYSGAYRLIVTIILLWFTAPYIGLQLGGMAKGLAHGSSLSVNWALVFVSGVLLVYVAIGGMRGVAWSDAIQGIVMTVGIFIVCYLILAKLPGSISEAAEKARTIKPGLFGVPGPRGIFTPVVLISNFLAIFSLVTWPHLFVRFLAARRRASFKAVATAFPIYEAACYIPIALVAIIAVPILFGGDLKPGEANLIFQRAALTLPYAFAGVLVYLAIFSGSMSTADSQVLVCSSMFTRDIIERLLGRKVTDREGVVIGRTFVALLIFVSAIIGLKYPGTLFRMAVKFAFPGYVQLLPPLLAGLFWRRATKEGAISGTIIGTIAVLLTTFVWPNLWGLTNLLWGVILNSIVLIIVSLLTPPPPADIVEKYHDFPEQAVYGKTG